MGRTWARISITLVIGVVAWMQMIDVYCVQNGGVSQQRMKGPQNHVENGLSYNLTPSSGQNGAYNMEVVSQNPARNTHFGIKAIGVTIVAFIAIIICGFAYYSHMPAKLGEAAPGKVGKLNRALNLSTNVPVSQQELFEQVTSMLEKPFPIENERGSWNNSMLKTIFQNNTKKGDVDNAIGSSHKSGKLAEMNIAEAVALDSSTTDKDSTAEKDSPTSDDNDKYINKEIVDSRTPAKAETIVVRNKKVIRDDKNANILRGNDADAVDNHDTAISDDIPLENKEHDDTVKNPTDNKGTKKSDKDEIIIEDGSHELENSLKDPSTGIEKAPSTNGGDTNKSVPKVDGTPKNKDDTGISDGSHKEENTTVETTTKHVSMDKAPSEIFIPDIVDEVCYRTAVVLYERLNKIEPGMHNSIIKLKEKDAHQMPIIKASLEATTDKNCGPGFFKIEMDDEKELIVFTNENYYVKKAIFVVSHPILYCAKAAEAIVPILESLGEYTDVNSVENTILDSKGVREPLLNGLRLTKGLECDQEFFTITEEEDRIILRYQNSNKYIKPIWREMRIRANCREAAKMFVKILKKKNVRKCNCRILRTFTVEESKELATAANLVNPNYCGHRFFSYAPFGTMSLSTYDDRNYYISNAFKELS